MFGFKVKVPAKRQQDCEAVCINYLMLQRYIMGMSQDDLLACIIAEKKSKNRVNILTRLYARFSEVRKDKERRELLS